MKKYPFSIRLCKKLINACKKTRVEGSAPHLPCVFLARHMNVKGVVRAFCDIPVPVTPWALSTFMDYKSAKRHFNEYTFSKRLKKSKVFRLIFSPLCAKTISRTLKKLNAIPVYRGKDRAKSITTIKKSVKALENGESLLIFPDVDYLDETEKESGEIYKGFALLDVTFYKRNKTHIPFVPVYMNTTTKILSPLFFSDNKADQSDFFQTIIKGLYQGKY